MAALDLIQGRTLAPDAALVDVTLASGDSLAIKNAPQNAYLLQIFTHVQGAGFLRIASPRMHDAAVGLRFRTRVADPIPLLPPPYLQPLYAQDTLEAQLSGSAVAGDIENMVLQIYYPSLPGSDGVFSDVMTIRQRMRNLYTQQVNLTAGTAGGYSGARAINADFDRMKANTDYALLGGVSDVTQLVITVRSPDTGNLRIAFPANSAKREITKNYFACISDKYGLPLIPIFNSANKGATTVETVNNENAASPIVTLFFAELV